MSEIDPDLQMRRLRWVEQAKTGAIFPEGLFGQGIWDHGLREAASWAIAEIERGQAERAIAATTPKPGWRCRLFGHAFEPRYSCEPVVATSAESITLRGPESRKLFRDLHIKQTYVGDVCYRCGRIA